MDKIKNILRLARHFIWSHKKISFAILVVLLILGYFSFPKGGKPVLTETVAYHDIVKSVSVTGDVAANNAVNLSFQTQETLTNVAVKLGDTVKKGSLIAAIDPEKLSATVRQAEQDFIAAKAASEKYYDNHKDTESFDEKVRRTAIDDAQNKAYDQLLKAKYDLGHSALYSPIDGIVTRLDADSAGENVNPTTIFTITDPKSLYFKMEVDQADIGKIVLNQDVEVLLDSFPDKTIKLSVSNIDFVSHKNSSGGNSFYVKAQLPENPNFRVGMSGNSDIIVSRKDNVLTIPTSSINNGYAYVLKNGKYYKTSVTTGLDNDIDVEVISGLSNGDVVALDASTPPQNLVKK